MRALLLPFLLICLAACGGGRRSDPVETGDVACGPVLAHLAPTSALVAWRTTTPQTARLEVGPTGGAVDVHQGPAALEHRFHLASLEAGTTYRWRAWAGGEPLGGEHVFTCPPAGTDRHLSSRRTFMS